MAWLFLIVAVIAGLFVLPGGTRSSADRRLAQIVAFVALSISVMAFGLKPIGAGILVIGMTLFGIGWLKDRLTGEGLEDVSEKPRTTRGPAPRTVGTMSRAEALNVLGLEEGASAGDVTAAHRRLITKAHPDGGGSDYLAAKVNEARDVLLA